MGESELFVRIRVLGFTGQFGSSNAMFDESGLCGRISSRDLYALLKSFPSIKILDYGVAGI